MKVDILIENTHILNPDYSFSKHMDVLIQNRKIVKIVPTKSEIVEAVQRIDGANKLTMPGLIDGHTHITQQLLRGMISDEFPIIYRRFNLPLESKLTEEEVNLSTKLACLEMIKAGTTAFADAGGRHMDKLVDAVLESGMRAVITRSTSDKGTIPESMKDSTEDALRLSEEFYHKYNNLGDGRIKAWFQYRTIASCTDELIIGLTDLAKKYKTGIHTHISEYGEAVLYTLREYGMREIEYLDHLGVLFDGLLAAHSALISENDINILARTNTKVVHCPRSNLGKAVTKTPNMLNHGISVGFGTDGTAHSGLSLWREITAFRHSQIVTNGVPYLDFSVMNSKMLLDMLLMGGARAIQAEKELGSVEVGKTADLITINLNAPHITPTHNLINTLMEAVHDGDVTDSIINGEVVMQDRVVLTLNEAEIMEQARKTMPKINEVNGWTDEFLFTVNE